MSRSKKDKSPKIIPDVRILDYAAEAKCIAKIQDEIVFVQGKVAKGDVCDLQILKSKKSFKQALAINIQPLSTDRTPAICQHFGACGGCKWQHVQYAAQTQFKTAQVQQQLQRIGKIPLPNFEPILGAPSIYAYRNKLEYTFSNQRWYLEGEEKKEGSDAQALGFHVPGRFDKVLPIEVCHLQADLSNQIRNQLDAFARAEGISYYDIKHQEEGALRTLMIRNSSLGQWMVLVQFAYASPEEIEKVMGFLANQFPEITSLLYVVNQKRNDTFHDLEVHCYKGKAYMEEQMEALTFRIGPKSFFQTNTEQALNLYRVVREFAELKPEDLVYDLYTGTGTIALFLAPMVKKMVGIEYVEMAVEDAKINAQVNGIAHAQFFAGDMKKIFTEAFIQEHGRPQVVITDPPRAGMDPEVCAQLLALSPERVVYVSCNPATQARDLALLDAQYRVEKVQPVDMFPHTHHVENVVKLVRKG